MCNSDSDETQRTGHLMYTGYSLAYCVQSARPLELGEQGDFASAVERDKGDKMDDGCVEVTPLNVL
jgi:hypothetical protein